MFQASNYKLAFTSHKMLFYAGVWGLAVRCRRFEPTEFLNDDYFENATPGTRSTVLLCSDIAQWLKQAASREHASII